MAISQWESYEKTAKYLLNQLASYFGLDLVEGKQSAVGKKSGTKWEIDAKGVKRGTEAFVVIECRRHTGSRIKQEQIGALAYRISDLGADGGIMVSPLGLQEGARKIAKAENIVSVRLDEHSTTENFILSFLNQIFLGVTDTIQLSEHVNIVILNDENKDITS